MPLILPQTLDRLDRLVYRALLAAAEAAGDTAFIDAELARNQLTAEDLERLQKFDTPMHEWPDADPAIFDGAATAGGEKKP